MDRRLFAKRRQIPGKAASPRIVSIHSGKGGVGKTVIACNLAERLASRGYRLLLVDADFNFGNVHIMTNTGHDYGVGTFATGRLSLPEASMRIMDRLDILASESNNDTRALYSPARTRALMRDLRRQASDYNLILVDNSSGRFEAAMVMASFSDLNILVMVPEVTSLSDGYGLFKHLVGTVPESCWGVLLNRCRSSVEADYVHEKFAALTERFLKNSPRYLGYLPEDPAVRESVSWQRLIANGCENASVMQPLTDIGHRLIEQMNLRVTRNRMTVEIGINENQAVADIKE